MIKSLLRLLGPPQPTEVVENEAKPVRCPKCSHTITQHYRYTGMYFVDEPCTHKSLIEIPPSIGEDGFWRTGSLKESDPCGCDLTKADILLNIQKGL